jgi:hypothetical protein
LAGVYVTHDSGSSWSPVFTNATAVAGGSNVITGTTDQLVLKLATGPNGSVAIAVAGGDVENGEAVLKGLYLSQDGGGSWAALATPDTNPAKGAIYKLAVAIDPSNTSTVYVSGDAVNIGPTFPAPVSAYKEIRSQV